MAWVYGVQSGRYIKVGIATSMRRRFENFRLHNPHPLKLVLRRNTPHARRMEIFIHRLLSDKAIGREWFDATPDEVRAAADQAAESLRAWVKAQEEWEFISSARARARAAARGKGRGEVYGASQAIEI